MNEDIPSRVLAIEARGRYEVSYFALKRASPAEQPRELIDRISMSSSNWIWGAFKLSERTFRCKASAFKSPHLAPLSALAS